jgi:hypothetical protein
LTKREQPSTLQFMPQVPPAPGPEWSWKDLIPLVPIVAGAFAFAYVVGYFLAFDIAWFPFFTLSEHVVFALRALPIAAGISFAFVIALELARHSSQQGRLKDYLSYSWLGALAVIAGWDVHSNHAGMALAAVLIGLGVFFYHIKPVIRTPFITALFWATNMMVVSVVIGYISGLSWKVSYLRYFAYSRAMAVPNPTAKGKFMVGHVIFSGAEKMLFYEFANDRTYLFGRDDRTEVIECPGMRSAQDTCQPLPSP